MSRNTRSAATQYDPLNQDGRVFRPHSERIVSATQELNRLADRIRELEATLQKIATLERDGYDTAMRHDYVYISTIKGILGEDEQ